jgi:hypothetical protein
MPKPKVLRNFTKLADAPLGEFATNVLTKTFGNPAFASPPFASPVLLAGRDDFQTKLAATLMGGRAATAGKNQARRSLIALLMELAGYVERASNGVLAVLLTSGFGATNPGNSRSPLMRPAILTIKHGAEGEILLRVPPIKNRRVYEARYQTPGGDWVTTRAGTDARRLSIAGLTPGVLYTIQIRALGGSTGSSPWCDAVLHRAM